MRLLNSLNKVSNWTEFTVSQREYSKKDQGTRFELLTKELFRLDPLYTSWIRNVWLSSELPVRVQKILNLKSDIGFDLILEDNDGRLIPVQCKYHSDPSRNVGWKEASTFVGLYNDKKVCQEAFLCSNAFGVSKNFDSLEGKPINRILGSQWSKLDASFFGNIGNRGSKELVPYRPLKHQEKAIQDAKSYFLKNGNTRGKLIFPCGSGKSLTGFWFTQHLNARTTLIAVPSLALIKQTLEVYFREIVAQNLNVKWLCVCSDSDIGSGVSEIKFSTSDIGIPSTTDPDKIKNWLKITKGDKRYVFTTYQSGQRLGEICKETGTQFDLGIFDEAHKTVGAKDKLFSHLLFHQNIKIERRIFMTATERFYTGSKDDIASMDNEEIYGEVFSKMSFKDAIATKLLTDYKIITIDVAKEEIASFIRKNKLVELNPKYGKEAEARSLASMFALRKAMQKLPIKNAVSFHSSIDKARRAESIQELLSKEFGFEEIDTFTVNGKDSVGKREKIINEFASSDNALITNARCLTEGVDVPKIDCIVFSDPKRSKVDIVQALGRALRKKQGKEWGYVILPVVYDDKTHEIDNDSFKDILGIVRGLAANDERIIEFFRESTASSSKEGSIKSVFETNYLQESISAHEIRSINVKIWQGLSKFSWLPFEKARQVVRSMHFSSTRDFRSYATAGNLPYNIPRKPATVYREEWNGYSDWLGLTKYSYFEALKIVHALSLKSQDDWDEYCKSEHFDRRLPKFPRGYYDEWTNLKEWLGWKYVSYEEAKHYSKSQHLNSYKEWVEKTNEREFPNNIPKRPNSYYINEWEGWKTFLGYDFLGYDEAKEIVHKEKLNSQTDWKNYIQSRKFNKRIPHSPYRFYKDRGWVDWGDFLGHGRISDNEKNEGFLDFEAAKKIVHSWKLESYKAWLEYAKEKNGNRPKNIPFKPNRTYANKGWNGWGDWLGTGKLGTVSRTFLDFESAKNYAQSLHLKSKTDWFDHWKKHERPPEIPSNPPRAYKNSGWLNWREFLGY